MSNYKVSIRNGEIHVSWWNPEKREREEQRKTDQVLSDVLQFPVEIVDTTFGQFFELIANEADLYDRIFKAAAYGHPIAPYVDEVRKPDGDPDSLEHVEVYWTGDYHEGDVEIGAGFHGWGRWSNEQNDPEMPEKGGIAIEFTPLNRYRMLPLKLDTKFKIHDVGDGGKKLVDGWRDFTVYDVIEAIIFEITWAGDISKGREADEEPVEGKEGNDA